MSNLLPLIQEIIFGRSSMKYAQGDRITMERVDSVQGNGRAQVRGVIVPITGLATVITGELVAVAWKHGVPAAIIKHRARRAQSHDHFHPGGGIVEQLLIGNFDRQGNTVWYRNSAKLVKVRVYTSDAVTGSLTTASVADHPGLQGAQPEEVQWGLDGKSFGVKCGGGVYAVFTFTRENQNTVDEKFPGPATLSWMDRPLTDTSPLTTVAFTNRVKRSIRYWIGKFFVTIVYRIVQSAWYDGAMYYYREDWAGLEQGWETTMTAEGAASVSTSQTFPLNHVLTGAVADWYGNHNCRGEVVEWFLDADRHLKFLLKVDWDGFWVGTSQIGSGTLHIPIGAGENLTEGYDEAITVGGTAVGCIGAKRQSDQQVVPETHLFVWDSLLKTVAWATASATPMLGWQQSTFFGRIYEHQQRFDPGYDESGLPEPHQPGWNKEPSVTEQYYTGANWSNLPMTTYLQEDWGCGDERGEPLSSTGTFQLFDPTKLACITGPFVGMVTGPSTGILALLGGYTAYYRVNYSTRQVRSQRYWHYRMQYGKVFTRRYVSGGANVIATGIDEPLLFVVAERYPYHGGTGFINDLPARWIGIVDLQGRIIKGLRNWQFGLAGAELVSANGHEVVWMLRTGALDPHPAYYVTNLDSGQEAAFTNDAANQILTGETCDALQPTDIAFFRESNAKLFTPNVLWSDRKPERFFEPSRLPVMVEDPVLEPVSHLTGGQVSGSTRMINDAALLMPLGKWQAS